MHYHGYVSSAKIPVFLLPTLNDNLANDGNIDISALVLASWAYYSQFYLATGQGAGGSRSNGG